MEHPEAPKFWGYWGYNLKTDSTFCFSVVSSIIQFSGTKDVLYVCFHGGLRISYVNNEKNGNFQFSFFLLEDVEDVNNKDNLSNLAKYDLIGYSLGNSILDYN